MNRRPVTGERLYRALLHLYPARFRAEFAEMMLDFFRARVRDAGSEGLRLRMRLYMDVCIHALVERIAPLRVRGDQFASEEGHAISVPEPRLLNVREDIRYAFRNLRRQPAFTTTVLLVLALGIGANVAIFSVVNGVLLRPLPFADASRVVQLASGENASTLSEPELADIERDADSFEHVGAYAYEDGTLRGSTDAERVRIARASGGFFAVLEPTPFLGRGLDTIDDRAGAPDVAVISYGLWARQFGMERDVIGRTLVLSDVPRTVVGVMPPHFSYPNSAVSVWVPLRLDRNSMRTRNNHYLRVIARLSSDASVESSAAEMRGLRDAWAVAYPDTYRPSDPLQVDVRPVRDLVLGSTQPYLLALFGAVGFVLLLACVNVANLLLVRGEQRRRELMIRRALGATRSRIVTQLSIESALLTLGGGLLGLAIAFPLLRMIVGAAPESIPRLGEIRLDMTALAFAAVTCAITGIVFALAPIARIASTGSFTGLNGASRNTTGGNDTRARRMRSCLAIAEVALSVVILSGAGAFVKALLTLQQTTLGFATERVMTARVTLPRAVYTGDKPALFVSSLVGRLRELPFVDAAAAMAWTPIVSSGGNWSLNAEGMPQQPISHAPVAEPQQVTPGYFAVMSIPFVAGRDFADSDRPTSEPVVIVNEALARLVWSSTDVLGRRIRLSANDMPWVTVVGIVGDTRVDGLTEKAPPVVYFPHQQARLTGYFASLGMTLLVRARGDESATVPAIRALVREMDPTVPVSEVRSMSAVVASSIARHRFATLLLSGLACVAILIAGIGVYGVIAHNVAQRRYEFGVRMALGAGRARVLSLVLGEGLGVAVAGLLLGAGGAAVLSRALSSILTGVNAPDGLTFGAVSALLIATVLLAAFIPARRAASIDPVETMRNS